MKQLFRSKWFKIPYTILLYGFAAYGAFLVAVFVAMKLHLTKEDGGVDKNDRYFQSMSDKYNLGFKTDSASVERYRYELIDRIALVNDFSPVNAGYIMDVYQRNNDPKLAFQMLDAVELPLMKNPKYRKAKAQLDKRFRDHKTISGLNAFDWMNVQEWTFFKEAVEKDKKWIDSAAKVTQVEPRLIVACLVGEQVRLFNSRRERFKNYVAPLKRLALETNLSYGVTGIKQSTAMKIENYLKDKNSVFYLGDQYAHLLDYDTTQNFSNNLNDTLEVRLQRLIQFNNHYYSYLYAAIFVKQIMKQWENAGFPIGRRPEVYASIYNLGYQKSVPKKNPQAGGSVFKIHDQEYTFGAVAFEFYWSGEMMDYFPYYSKMFDWNPSEMAFHNRKKENSSY